MTIKEKIDKVKDAFGKKTLGIRVYKTTPELTELEITESNVSHEKSISQVPMQDGSLVNDNAIVKPTEVSFNILISDQPTGYLGSISNVFQDSKIDPFLKLLDELMKKHYFLDVLTNAGEYKNMQLVRYSYSDNSQSQGSYYNVSITCQEVLTYQVTTQDKKQAIIKEFTGLSQL